MGNCSLQRIDCDDTTRKRVICASSKPYFSYDDVTVENLKDFKFIECVLYAGYLYIPYLPIFNGRITILSSNLFNIKSSSIESVMFNGKRHYRLRYRSHQDPIYLLENKLNLYNYIKIYK
jgi:hypothetical protein